MIFAQYVHVHVHPDYLCVHSYLPACKGNSMTLTLLDMRSSMCIDTRYRACCSRNRTRPLQVQLKYSRVLSSTTLVLMRTLEYSTHRLLLPVMRQYSSLPKGVGTRTRPNLPSHEEYYSSTLDGFVQTQGVLL